MKIKVTVTLDIDPQAWAETYGLEFRDVADDAKEYWRTYLHDSADHRLRSEHLGHVTESV